MGAGGGLGRHSWRLWERSPDPPAIRLQPERDIEILRFVFEHRFLQPSHIHALLGKGSLEGLGRRMRLLWQHGYLERPRAQRPRKILTEEIIYGLGGKGARHLEGLEPGLAIGRRDWGKGVRWPYLDHQLGVATFMVCVRLAAKRRGVGFAWGGHFNRRQWRIEVPGEGRSMLADAHFVLRMSGRGVAHHYLEVDRGNVSLRRMRERYEGYYRFWRDGSNQRGFRHFRVLTVTEEPERGRALRRAAIGVGRGKGIRRSWRALMFSSFTEIGLEEPERVLGQVWRYADEEEFVGLL